jgi:hypothetical protein
MRKYNLTAKMKKILFFLFTFSFLFSSCTTVYIPTEVNTPVFRDEHRVTAGLSFGISGIGLQSGYSLTKQFAVIADGSYLDQKGNDNEDFLKYGEIGLGYYRTIDRSKLVSFEVFTGLGFASARSKDVKFDYTETGNYYKLFLQPDVAFSLGWMDFIFACKVSVIKFTSYSYMHQKDIITEGLPSAIEIQPAFTFRLGSPVFKIRYQLGTSSISRINGPVFGSEKLFSAFGVVFQF